MSNAVSKRSTVEIFRQRLKELIASTGHTRARFAELSGLDRSTLSQLLSEENVRLPRGETIARIATCYGASVDWLLGLSQQSAITADVVSTPVVAQGADDPADERLKRWLEEAGGAKIRYVPATIPDQVKTEAVIAYESRRQDQGSALVMAETSRLRIEHAQQPESEIEVCSSRQSLELFAKGEGTWKQLPQRDRRRQLEHMAAFVAEAYPAYRWFLYDGRERYAAPYTVFGQKRAAVYMGSMYLVFTSTEHIRELTRHFDDLIRHAVVQPNETASFISRLARDIP
jgi:transcriptional regulator with XRE-family HTH domain